MNKFVTAYGDKTACSVDCPPDENMTKQCFKDECDVNNVVRRYQSSGIDLSVAQSSACYGDFSEIDDYHGAMNKIAAVQSAFECLPAKVRETFKNDAGLFFDFVQNPANASELHKYGLDAPPASSSVDATPDKVASASPSGEAKSPL